MTVGEAAAWMVDDSRVQGSFLAMPDASLPVVCVCVSVSVVLAALCLQYCHPYPSHEVSCL